jgi:phospholipase/lecithinase/hemolysin
MIGSFSAMGAYSSLYVFGDALSSTIDNPSVGVNYYGNRWSNGRVWVEVLAQRQGVIYEPTKNNSYFDHNSAKLATEITNFSALDASTALFVVWVCNADTFDAASTADPSQWNNAVAQGQINHLNIITNLYAKGVRTLILPNAVDISKIPYFNQGDTTGMANGCIAYNAALSNTISQAKSLCPDLKIYAPDFFSLMNRALTNAAAYGLTNVLVSGQSIDAIDAFHYGYPVAMTNGYGTNYIFWDAADPTAKFHAVMADVAQQLLSPVQFTGIVQTGGSNQLDVMNMPIGMNGSVLCATNLTQTKWLTNSSFTGTMDSQSVFVSPNGSVQYYRLYFPWQWTWP